MPGDVADERTSVSVFSRSVVDFVMGKTVYDPGYLHYADVDGDGVISTSDWLHIDYRIGDVAPSGLPAAAASDAPTTSHFGLVTIDDDAVDIAISLWDAFDDEEETDTQLTYSVTSVSDPSLLDSYSIDPLTGSLVVNGFTPQGGGQVAGRTEVTVMAMDSSGQTSESVLTIDLHRTNAAPSLTASPTQSGRDYWTVSGWVTDADDDLDDFWVVLSGAFSAIVSVAEDGFYSYTSTLPGYGFSEVFVSTNDPNGLSAQPLLVYLGW